MKTPHGAVRTWLSKFYSVALALKKPPQRSKSNSIQDILDSPKIKTIRDWGRGRVQPLVCLKINLLAILSFIYWIDSPSSTATSCFGLSPAWPGIQKTSNFAVVLTQDQIDFRSSPLQLNTYAYAYSKPASQHFVLQYRDSSNKKLSIMLAPPLNIPKWSVFTQPINQPVWARRESAANVGDIGFKRTPIFSNHRLITTVSTMSI